MVVCIHSSVFVGTKNGQQDKSNCPAGVGSPYGLLSKSKGLQYMVTVRILTDTGILLLVVFMLLFACTIEQEKSTEIPIEDIIINSTCLECDQSRYCYEYNCRQEFGGCYPVNSWIGIQCYWETVCDTRCVSDSVSYY